MWLTLDQILVVVVVVMGGGGWNGTISTEFVDLVLCKLGLK